MLTKDETFMIENLLQGIYLILEKLQSIQKIPPYLIRKKLPSSYQDIYSRIDWADKLLKETQVKCGVGKCDFEIQAEEKNKGKKND
jgi:hypothetical protein